MNQGIDPINELNSLMNSIQQNRELLKNYLFQLQQQSKNVLQQIQQLQEQQAVLQNSLNNDLSQFEQKASTGQGLQGLFNGNQNLKNEIMQKRVSLEKNVGQLRQATQQLMDKLNQMGGIVRQMENLPDELQQGEDSLQTLQQAINSFYGFASPAAPSALPASASREDVLESLAQVARVLQQASDQIEQKQALQQLAWQADRQLQQWQGEWAGGYN